MTKKTNAYSSGLKKEAEVKTRLIEAGYDVEEPTEEEDYELDIDGYLDGVPMSIKYHNPKYGNIALELMVYDVYDKVWYPSWFYNSKAKLLLSLVGTDLYQTSFKKLRKWVNESGLQSVTTLRTTTQRSQRNIKHRHRNALLGLFSVDDGVDSSILAPLLSW